MHSLTPLNIPIKPEGSISTTLESPALDCPHPPDILWHQPVIQTTYLTVSENRQSRHFLGFHHLEQKLEILSGTETRMVRRCLRVQL